ncbi:MAG: hypothetical protein ACRYGF_17505 [Janthinobacterium lividum]
MPDIDPKLLASLGNINLKTTPNINVNPTPQTGGPTPDQWSVMQNAITALQAANSTLTNRVAELEKSNVAIRLVMQGIDPAFNTVKQQIADLHAENAKAYTEYDAHTHALPFDFEAFDFIEKTPSNNKPSFLMAYVWEGSNQPMTNGQRQQDAQDRGQRTSAPVKKH